MKKLTLKLACVVSLPAVAPASSRPKASSSKTSPASSPSIRPPP